MCESFSYIGFKSFWHSCNDTIYTRNDTLVLSKSNIKFIDLISIGYSVQGNVAEAFRILNFMISKEILPNSYTLTALMKTCVTKGDWERARELLTIGTHTRPSIASSSACYIHLSAVLTAVIQT